VKLAADRVALWREHPSQMVRDLFRAEPEPWQEECLEAFPHHQRICMKASKGPGKTCVEAWLIWNFMLTRPHPKVAATAITGPNLADNLWTELALWQNKSPLLQRLFTWTKKRIFANDHPETWWCSARTSPQDADKTQQANTLAGLHADYIMFVLDESGGMHRAIMASAEAALSSCKEGHIVQAGNPTHLEGPLYDACTIERRLWKIIEINGDPDNPKRARRVSIDWAKEQIEKYGRDNPFVLVNVFGQFPPASLNALIGPDEVSQAMKRMWREDEIAGAPKAIGVDVALEGDDSSVIARRQGIQIFPLSKYRNIRPNQGAGIVARVWNDWEADAAFVDNTGGFGSGWIDQLRLLGKSPIGVQFAGAAHQSNRYFNKRTEMAFEFVEWIKAGGAIPENPELAAALTQTTYSFKGDRLILEPKKLVKIKLGYSPDEFDGCMLTFAEPLAARATARPVQRPPERYKPFAEMDRDGPQFGGPESGYSPFRE
jgi:phage terminase large subunit